MGDVADMMMDGTLCAGCGCALRGHGDGEPRYCKACGRDKRAADHAALLEQHQLHKKVPCPTCGRKVRRLGMDNHQRDAHGAKA